MVRREISLIDNDILLAAVYIDPIYRVSLTEEEQQKAKSALCNVVICIKGLQEVQEEKETSEHIVSDETTTIPLLPSQVIFQLDIEELSGNRRLLYLQSKLALNGFFCSQHYKIRPKRKNEGGPGRCYYI